MFISITVCPNLSIFFLLMNELSPKTSNCITNIKTFLVVKAKKIKEILELADDVTFRLNCSIKNESNV